MASETLEAQGEYVRNHSARGSHARPLSPQELSILSDRPVSTMSGQVRYKLSQQYVSMCQTSATGQVRTLTQLRQSSQEHLALGGPRF